VRAAEAVNGAPPPKLLKVWLEKLRSPLWTRWLGSMSNMVCTWQTLKLLAVGNSVPQVEWTEKGSFFLWSSLCLNFLCHWSLEIFFRILERMRSNTLLCLIYLLEPSHSGASHWSKFNAPLCSVDILADLSVEGLKPVAHLHDLWLSSEVFPNHIKYFLVLQSDELWVWFCIQWHALV
jgi:hypothetical protein